MRECSAGLWDQLYRAIGGFLAFLLMTAITHQNAAAEKSFGEPEINGGKALIVLALIVGFGIIVCGGFGAAIGVAIRRR